MELKVENENNFSASFLDLALALGEGVIDTKLFDKRDAFNFSVVRMPYKCSNIPKKMFFFNYWSRDFANMQSYFSL